MVIGGVAGGAHGSSLATFDVDLAYGRDTENLEKVAAVLKGLDARLRGAPPDVPFLLDAKTLAAGANFTFTTSVACWLSTVYPASTMYRSSAKPRRRATSVVGSSVRLSKNHRAGNIRPSDLPLRNASTCAVTICF